MIPLAPRSTRIAVLTTLAMLAFAANSLLCRLALGPKLIDAATFTSVRIASGAVMLALIVMATRQSRSGGKVGWRSPAALLAYMITFSFAYVSLTAGTGALILFAAVQLTMFSVALCEGERFTALSWGGLSLAIAGLIYLVLPGVGAPDLLGAVLMALSGVAWGFYSLLGRHATNPLNASARNFIYLVPAAAIFGFLGWPYDGVTMSGLALAVASGAIASGAGYVIWYSALPGLGASRAATVQLSVPALAAFGGVIFLAEPVTLRLLAASALTLGGVAIVLTQRAPHTLRPASELSPEVRIGSDKP